MKKIYTSFLIILVSIVATPVLALKIQEKPVYTPITPEGFSAITWVDAPGINSYFKAPKESGAVDFLTRIYLPQNQINFIFGAGNPQDLNVLESKPFFNEEINPTSLDINNYHNLSFNRIGSEQSKSIDTGIKFIWDAAFFNMKPNSTDLSMAVKYSINGKTTITSGSRSVPDMARARRMLIINNKNSTALIKDFNSSEFIDNKTGDQALEGFSSNVTKNDDGATASRLFLGVSNDGKELVVYCSQLATEKEASSALIAAGIPIEHQLQADGGGSASCGYNLPGQFFVEPVRTLPLLMGAKTILLKGKITSNNVNVRDNPSTKNKPIKKLSKDADVVVFEENNGWYRIGDGEWVSKAFVK